MLLPHLNVAMLRISRRRRRRRERRRRRTESDSTSNPLSHKTDL
jgi:hypothetical protein